MEETEAVPAMQVSRLTVKRGKKASASKHEHRNGAAGTFFKFKKERKGRRGFGWFKVRRLHGAVPRKSQSFNFCHFVQTNPIIFWLCSFFGPLPQFFTSGKNLSPVLPLLGFLSFLPLTPELTIYLCSIAPTLL